LDIFVALNQPAQTKTYNLLLTTYNYFDINPDPDAIRPLLLHPPANPITALDGVSDNLI
jgi:hypothetical protein